MADACVMRCEGWSRPSPGRANDAQAAPRHRSTTEENDLQPIAEVWHLLNFFAPALGLGVFASALAKIVWRAELKAVSWLRLCVVVSGLAAVVLVGGLVVFGRDGRLMTYATMVGASALSLWWIGFRPFRR